MNPMDMLNLQRDVKENAEVMQATSRELQNWEKDMKKKEQQIKIYRQQSEVRNVPTNKNKKKIIMLLYRSFSFSVGRPGRKTIYSGM